MQAAPSKSLSNSFYLPIVGNLCMKNISTSKQTKANPLALSAEACFGPHPIGQAVTEPIGVAVVNNSTTPSGRQAAHTRLLHSENRASVLHPYVGLTEMSG
jgi:hypothetical protein